MPSNKRLLFTFDLDGVLHINPFGRKVFPDVRTRLKNYVTSAQLADRATSLDLHFEEDGAALSTGDEAEDTVMRLIVAESKERLLRGRLVAAYDWDDIVASVATRLGYPGTIDVLGMVKESSVKPYIDLHPHAVESLSFLHDRGVRLVTLSNGFDMYQYPVLRSLGIAHFFHARVAPDTVGHVKPLPEPFAAALREGAAGMADDFTAVHVGDSLIHDVFGGNRAGVITVWVHRALATLWPNVSPQKRVRLPEFQDVVKQRFVRELNVPAYGINGHEEAMPDYAVASLHELKDVYEHVVDRMQPGASRIL